MPQVTIEETGTLSRRGKQLTDTQIFTLAVAIGFPIVALIYSQVTTKDRFSDLIKSLDNRFDGLNKRLDALEKHSDEKIDNAFSHMELLLKLHEAEHHKH
jgi:hypothetical protein